MRSGIRGDYLVAKWEDGFDASLEELIYQFPDIVLGHYVTIISCDSGLYTPTETELFEGWHRRKSLTQSPRIRSVNQLPMPGFDEWYVHRENRSMDNLQSFVNEFGFSCLKKNDESSEAFWLQVEHYKPMHVLGAGTSLFFATQDEALFKKVTRTKTPALVLDHRCLLRE